MGSSVLTAFQCRSTAPIVFLAAFLSSLAFHVLWDRVPAPPRGIFPWLITLLAWRFPPLKYFLLFLATSFIVKSWYIIPLYCWCIHLSIYSCISLLQFIFPQEFCCILNSSIKNPASLCFISTAALLNTEFLLLSVPFDVEHCPEDISCVTIAPYVQGDYYQPTFWHESVHSPIPPVCFGAWVLCLLTTNWAVRQSVSAEKEFSAVCEMILWALTENSTQLALLLKQFFEIQHRGSFICVLSFRQ